MSLNGYTHGLFFVTASLSLMSFSFAEESGADRQVQILESEPILILPPLAEPRTETLEQIRREAIPLTPAEIRRFQRYLSEKDKALYQRPTPAIHNRTHSVSLAPGAEFPLVTISPGYVGTIVLTDMYGSPWPISGEPAVGNMNLYHVVVAEGTSRNVITISAKTEAGGSNLSISLRDQIVPLIIQLKTSAAEMDGRSNIRIESIGPATNPALLRTSGTPDGAPDPVMLKFLDAVPPPDAMELLVTGGPFRGWEYGGALFLRTNATVRSPRPTGIVNGTGGVRVYRLPRTPVVLYHTQEGKLETLRITLRTPSNREGITR